MNRSWRLGLALALLAAFVLVAASGVMAAPKVNIGGRALPLEALKLQPPGLKNLDDLSQTILLQHPDTIFGSRNIVTEGSQLPPAQLAQLQNLASQKGPIARQDSPFIADLTKIKGQGLIKGKQYEISRDFIRNLKLADVSVDIDYVEAVARGEYFIHFRYSIIRPENVTLPLRFHLRLEGPAYSYVGWIPFVHTSGPADDVNGTVVGVMIFNNPPINAASTSVGVGAIDANGKDLGVFKKPLAYTFWKRYEDITRDNIRDYINRPGAAHPTIKIAGASPSIAAEQYRFRSEPALLLFRTNQGNYAKALVKAQMGTSEYHLAIWDARCYARDQATFNSWPFMSSGSPSNTEYTQLFGRGGYIFNTWGFDFDKDGENYPIGADDVWVSNPSGPSTARLDARGTATIAW